MTIAELTAKLEAISKLYPNYQGDIFFAFDRCLEECKLVNIDAYHRRDGVLVLCAITPNELGGKS